MANGKLLQWFLLGLAGLVILSVGFLGFYAVEAAREAQQNERLARTQDFDRIF